MEELQQRVAILEHCLLAELQRVLHEYDELEEAVVGAEKKLCEKEDDLTMIIRNWMMLYSLTKFMKNMPTG